MRNLVIIIGLLHFAALSSNECSDAEAFVYRELDSIHGKNLVADVDNDGRNDVITVATGESGEFVWYRYLPDNSFEKSTVIENLHFRSDRIEVADIDGDGYLDVIVGYRGAGSEIHLGWLRNPLPEGNPAQMGSWELIPIGPHGDEEDGRKSYIKDMVVADFDRDGKPDIATRTNIMTRIFFQNSPTEWVKKVEIEHESHEGMDTGDLDGDGDVDLVLNGFWFETPSDARNGTYRKHIFDDKWFGQTEGTWRDDNADIKVADITGNGFQDILISHSEKPGYPISLYTVESAEQAKTGSWTEIQVAEVFDYCQTLDVADVNGDGNLDILAAKFERDHDHERWRNKPPYPVVIFYNVSGDGREWQPSLISELGMYAGSFGDVGSNGNIDIVGSRSYWKGPTDFYENIGNGN